MSALGGLVTVRRGRRARLDGSFGTIPGASDMPSWRVLRTLVYVATARGGISRRWWSRRDLDLSKWVRDRAEITHA